MSDNHPSSGHIKFREDVSFDSHAVHCRLKNDSLGTIDVGLLQVLHTYIISFDMQHPLGIEVDIPPLQTPAVVIISLRKLENAKGHHVVLEIKCGEDEFIDEEVTFENSKNQTFILKIHGKLMASHLGTPSLKSGIKLLHKPIDDLSDADSDWQGFQ